MKLLGTGRFKILIYLDIIFKHYSSGLIKDVWNKFQGRRIFYERRVNRTNR